MNEQELISHFVDYLLEALAFGVVGILGSSMLIIFSMWIDVRSLKKSMNAAFRMIRENKEGEKACGRE